MLIRSILRPARTAFRTVPAISNQSVLLRALHTRTAAAPSRPLLFTAFGLSASVPLLLGSRRVTYNDVSPANADAADFSTGYSHSKDAKTPLTRDGRTLNPAAVKQISLGSILGLGAGVVVSAFSRSLTLLVGVGLVFWQWAARKGYNIIPVERMQRYVRGVDLRSAINDNVAFKISFGLMFALSAFGEF